MTCLMACDAGDLLTAARAYADSFDGDLPDAVLPESLRGKISARSPKHPNRAAAVGSPAEPEKETLPRFKGLPRRA